MVHFSVVSLFNTSVSPPSPSPPPSHRHSSYPCSHHPSLPLPPPPSSYSMLSPLVLSWPYPVEGTLKIQKLTNTSSSSFSLLSFFLSCVCVWECAWERVCVCVCARARACVCARARALAHVFLRVSSPSFHFLSYFHLNFVRQICLSFYVFPFHYINGPIDRAINRPTLRTDKIER